MWDLSSLVNDVSMKFSRLVSQVYYRRVLRSFGAGSTLRRPILVRGGRWISIGARTLVRDGARLEAIHRPGQPEPRLSIGNRVLIEQNAHIVCSSEVTIEDDVAIAAGCSIVDTTHPVPGSTDENVGFSILAGTSAVRIGAGSMLGVGVVVLADVTIGRNCLIGANSVVTRNIPDGSVAVGSPARVVRTVGDQPR